MTTLNIAGFVKNLIPSLSRSDLETDLSISVETLPIVISTYQGIVDVQKVAKFKSDSFKKMSSVFHQELTKAKTKADVTSRGDLAMDLVTLFNNSVQNVEHVKKELEDLTNEVIVTQALTAYKTNIIRAVGHFYFITRFALDLANHLYSEEVVEAGEALQSDAKPNKKQLEFLNKNLVVFTRLLAVYGDEPKVFKERLEELGDISIPKEQLEEALAVYDQRKIDIFNNNLPAGFIGSPIYTFGLLFAEWQADRHKQLKDKRKLLELRLLHLRMVSEQGQSDANIEKEIGHLQRRVTDIDYAIAKIEDSVE